MTNLVALIERYSAVRLTSTSRHYRHGAEYCGPCPFCGLGKDRFRVWPDASYPHYWCRVCSAWGNGLRFLTQQCNMTSAEAYEALDIDPILHHSSLSNASRRAYEPHLPPCRAWQDAGGRLLLKRRSGRGTWP